jgi:ParB/RepB/Spo0J family partition protein
MTSPVTEYRKIYHVPVEDIRVSDSDVRHTDRERDVEELAGSIERHGLLQPVVLLGSPEDRPPHKLIVGQRRFYAHRDILAKKHSKWRQIQAVFAGRLDSTEATIWSLAENMHRVNLNHADAATAITDLYRGYGGKYGRDDRRVAKETGLSLQRVRQYIEIEEMASPHMKKAIRAKRVSPRDVKRVLRAAGDNIERAERMLDMMWEEHLTDHEKARALEYAQENPRASLTRVAEEARRPRVERSIVVPLQTELQKALQAAVDALHMAPEEVASQALGEWLRDQGFYP